MKEDIRKIKEWERKHPATAFQCRNNAYGGAPESKYPNWYDYMRRLHNGNDVFRMV